MGRRHRIAHLHASEWTSCEVSTDAGGAGGDPAAMRVFISPGTRPDAIRVCLGAVRDVIRLTEVVARLPMVAPDDHAPDEVCADITPGPVSHR